jgi:hypothetical protein
MFRLFVLAQFLGFPNDRAKLVDLADLGGQDGHAAAGEHLQAHVSHLHRFDRPIQPVISDREPNLVAAAKHFDQIGKCFGQRRCVGVFEPPLLDRQPLQCVHDVGDRNVLWAAACAEVTGNARPHRIGRQHLVALVGVDQGKDGAGSVFHVGAAWAGTAATAALQAMDDSFAIGSVLDNLFKERSLFLGRMSHRFPPVFWRYGKIPVRHGLLWITVGLIARRWLHHLVCYPANWFSFLSNLRAGCDPIF